MRAARRIAAVAVLLGVALSSPAAARASLELPAEVPAAPRFELRCDADLESLLVETAGGVAARRRLWTHAELMTLAERVRERLAQQGALSQVLELTLARGPGSSAGSASVSLVSHGPAGAGGAGAPPLKGAVVVGADGILPDAARVFEAAGGALAPAGRIAAGLHALRERARERGHYAAEARLDSIGLAEGGPGGAVRAHVRLLAGPPVRVESFELSGAVGTRPSAAAAIAGLKPGRLLTPAALEEGRERLAASELFVSVGPLEARPGSDPSRARVVAAVEEARLSRFEGAVGFQNDGGLTGLADLALGNLAGSGRSAGARWAGFGAGRSDYAARYREPALLGRGVDATLALEARVLDSLYTQTRWSLLLGARPASRTRATLGLERSGTVYGGAARGSSAAWAIEGAAAWEGLVPRSNPQEGIQASASLRAGRRVERMADLDVERRVLLRGSASLAVARATGASRCVYAAARAEQVTLGGSSFPAEELRYLGGSEGLRGHADRAFAGNRIAAATLEHRWRAAGPDARSYLFVDAAYHQLDAPLQAGAASGIFASGPLARTALSTGWEFGYGAGIRAPTPAGTIGVELGLRPGAAIREAQLHFRYASTW